MKFRLLILAVLSSFTLMAEENVTNGKTSKRSNKGSAASCEPATSQTDLDINNVRTTLLNGGDLWWNLSNARYEIPKVEPGSGDRSLHSLFAGAIWIGGLDEGNQLKIAAQTYRQTGDDFWPGPLDPGTASIDKEDCDDYDRHWKVNGQDVDDHREKFATPGTTLSEGDVPKSILEWPAIGNPFAKGKKSASLAISQPLAPFHDSDDDGIYNPLVGDYPILEINRDTSTSEIIPDQMVWWVYNDKGNIHSETQGVEIGLEIQANAFGFSTNDEVNDMTFYQYKVINRATQNIKDTYMAQWVDPDLGCFSDDYVGCDVGRSLGICYNGDANDEDCASLGYGADIPLVGVDFFQGPTFIDDSTGLEVELGMSAFVYYENDFSVRGNPEQASHFYGYMSGFWKDATPITVGGNGYGGTTPVNYMYPDDPTNSLGWSECTESNPPFDRRFVQSSGPFVLEPGAVNEIIVGVVWVRPKDIYPCPRFSDIQTADDKAQALFDNAFKLVDGPDAPDVTVIELDKEIVITLENNFGNNINESYLEIDPLIKPIADSAGSTDFNYEFQGYMIYQLSSATVSSSELSDPDKARLIFQVDKEDGVKKLVNLYFDPNIGLQGAEVPVLEVDGADKGIEHVFRVTEDAFASGDPQLVNHKTYYFTVLAYAHNQFEDPSTGTIQKFQFKAGRKNVATYSAIPHNPAPEVGGTILHSNYGNGPQITRLGGNGTGGRFLDLTAGTINNILQFGADYTPTYEGTRGPVDVMVFNPAKVPASTFTLTFNDSSAGTLDVLESKATWTLTNNSTGEIVQSNGDISLLNQQVMQDWGFVVGVEQVPAPYDTPEGGNGFLDATIEFADPSDSWLTGLPDQDGENVLNWIRAGDFSDDNAAADGLDHSDRHIDITGPPASEDWADPDGFYEGVLGGTWAPYVLVSGCDDGPAKPNCQTSGGADKRQARLVDLPSVDIVLTSDKSKWTRCVVLEMGEEGALNEGGVDKFESRAGTSVDKDGNLIPGSTGLGWFPGYAIDVEHGKRLNMMFGEDSWLAGENGRDMIWNPTDVAFSRTGEFRVGGKHYIYVLSTQYTGSESDIEAQRDSIDGSFSQSDNGILKTFQWVSMAYLSFGSELRSVADGIVPNDVTIKIRTEQPYRRFNFGGATNVGYPQYEFNMGALAAETGNEEAAKKALDLVNVVPNPYYAFSEYEKSQLDNTVKIVNLPSQCKVSIYSIDGALIKSFDRDIGADQTLGGELGTINLDSSIDWDLTNNANVPVASGVYLIHIESEKLGEERVIKWFGVMRPIDIDSF